MIVIKRDGTKENFDIDKIQRAVYSAFKAVGKPMPDYLVKMIDSLFSQLEGDAIGVEEIQDKIENILMNDKFFIERNTSRQDSLERGLIIWISIVSPMIMQLLHQRQMLMQM